MLARTARLHRSCVPLLATTALALAPPRGRCDRGDRFFGSQQGDDDVARLRRENAELKRKLRAAEPADDGGGLFGGLAKLFGGQKSEQERALEQQQSQISKEIDEVFKGGGLVGGLMGAVAKGVVGLAGKAMAETQQDVALVYEALRLELEGRLGPDVRGAARVRRRRPDARREGAALESRCLVEGTPRSFSRARWSRGRALPESLDGGAAALPDSRGRRAGRARRPRSRWSRPPASTGARGSRSSSSRARRARGAPRPCARRRRSSTAARSSRASTWTATAWRATRTSSSTSRHRRRVRILE